MYTYVPARKKKMMCSVGALLAVVVVILDEERTIILNGSSAYYRGLYGMACVEGKKCPNRTAALSGSERCSGMRNKVNNS